MAQCDRARLDYGIASPCRLYAVDDVVVANLSADEIDARFPSDAAAPRSRPMVRLETGMHTAVIRRLAVDRAARLLATASDDKTVRLWSLPEGRPLGVLRVPAGTGNEGKVYAVALSPDGKVVAAGGPTGFEWAGTGFVYLFDTATGRLVGRLGGLPEAIQHLAFSPDGRHLAATLWGRNGIRVWQTGDWTQVVADADYGASSYWADFDARGRLAVTSYDGFIRLYDRTFRRMATVRAPGGRQPYGIAFSPDGRRLAVGYADAARVDVLSASDLALVFPPDVTGVAKGSLGTVGWSADGRFLFAGGRWIDGTSAPIRRWAEGGRGAHTDLAAARNTIRDIRALSGGTIVFASHDPVIGTFDGGGRKVLERRSAIADFRDNALGFLVSTDGSEVRFGFEAWGRRPARFSLNERTLLLDSAEASDLLPPSTAAVGLTVTDWQHTRQPKLNGRPLSLDEGELSRSLAVAPDGDSVLLGAEWTLRLFAADGSPKWRVPLPGVAWAVNVSGDGRMALAALGDGTIRWFRMEDGREILALFPHRDGKEWVAWTPDGYYLSSPGGDDLIGWHVNQGKAAAADFYAARQFERILHRPEYVLAYFAGRGERGTALPQTGDDFFDIGQLASIAPPKIGLTVKAVDGGRARLGFTAEKRSLPMRDFAVFVNGIPVTPAARRTLAGDERDSFTRDVDVPLFADDNRIRVEAFNGTSLGVAEIFVRRKGGGSAAPPGDLYLLAVGVSRFPGVPGADLDYAALDAEAFAGFFRGEADGVFGRVFVRTVTDFSPLQPTRRTIVEALDFVKRASARDTVIVFLASHGLSDRRGDYFFVPRDARAGDVEAVMASARSGRALAEGGGGAPSLISWERFFETLRATAGRRLLVVDTCQARNIAGVFDVHSLAKRSASASFALMAASRGGEESQEYPPGRHGLFTFALLEGLSGKGDGDGDGRITLAELFDFAVRFVKTNRILPDSPQTPQLTAPGMLGEMVLAGT